MLKEAFLNKLMLFSNRESNNKNNALFSPYSLKLGLLSFLQDTDHDRNFTQLLEVLKLNSSEETKDIVDYEKNFHSVLLNETNDSQIKMCNKVVAARYSSTDSFPNYNILKHIKEICFQAEHTPLLNLLASQKIVDAWLTKVFGEDVKYFDSENVFSKSKTILINANLLKVLWDDIPLHDSISWENFR